MKFVKYRYLGTTLASVTLTNPPVNISLFPNKTYKLDSENSVIQQWERRGLLQPLEEVKISTKSVTVPPKKSTKGEAN